jgi:hypothetical protein
VLHVESQSMELKLGEIEVDQLKPLACCASKAKGRRTGARYGGKNIVVIDPVDAPQLGFAHKDRADRLSLAQGKDNEFPALAVGPDIRNLGTVGRDGHILQRRKTTERCKRHDIGRGGRVRAKAGGCRAGCDGAKESAQRGQLKSFTYFHPWSLFGLS